MQYDLTDAASVNANQRGELTDSQRQRANRAAKGYRGCLGLLARWALLPVAGGLLLAVLVALRVPSLVLWTILLVLLIAGTESLMLVLPPFIQRRHLLRRDLAEERLDAAEGQLAYVRHGYEAVVDNRVLLLPRSQTELRPNILYRFYFLPRSGYVLSAEELGASETEGARAALLAALSYAFGFDERALQANRQGQLIWGQRLRLLLQLFTVSDDFHPGQVLADFASGRVEGTEGVGGQTALASRHRLRVYRIGTRCFVVPPGALEILIDGLPYRAYHTPRSGILVSIEPLAGRGRPKSGLVHGVSSKDEDAKPSTGS